MPAPAFQKPSRKPREEPEGLDAFAAGAAGTTVVRVLPAPSSEVTDKPSRYLSMNVRFTPEEKAALEKLAHADQRSQQQVLMRLAGPLLIAKAAELG